MNDGVLSVVGKTPLVRLSKMFGGCDFNLYAKLECLNPGGSMKDRPAFRIIKEGLADGVIKPGTVIIESSSGNMGIGLAQACSYFNLRVICVVDTKTTPQNLSLLRAYGAEVEIVRDPDPHTGEFLQSRLNRVHELLRTTENSFWPNQYANRYNPLSHLQTMDEIVTALDGKVDYMFCATSTCGTVRGCADYVYERGLPTRMVAVDAVGSIIFGGQKAKRLIPGHGAAVRPQHYRENLVHTVELITDLECIVGCRRLARREAILAGGSSGAVLMAVERLRDQIPPGANCVAIIADRGERYLDTIYSDEWVREHFGEVAHLWEETAESPAPAYATVVS